MFTQADTRELGARWGRARRAALRAVLDDCADESESVLAVRAADRNRELLLASVFGNSRRLGEGFCRYHDVTITLESLPGLLTELDEVPCLRNVWQTVPNDAAAVCEQDGCGELVTGALCDYWREAIEGLVLGLTHDVRYARHRSRGHGDALCRSALFTSATSPRRFGEIPEAMQSALDGLRRRLALMNAAASPRFLGLSEGVLFYELARAGHPDAPAVAPVLARFVTERFPGVSVRDVTPRAVMD